MSFRCDNCGNAAPKGVSPTVVTKSQVKEYYEPDEHGTLVQKGVGFETVREFRHCPACAGKVVVPDVALDHSKHILLAKGYIAHAKGCEGFKTHRLKDGTKERTPCLVCARIIETFAAMPAQALAEALMDTVAPSPNFTFASVAVDNLIARTLHDSKRAKADAVAGMYALKGFETRGGGI